MNNDYSLIDAANGRAREGLRVLGEIARYHFKNPNIYNQCRAIRHYLITIEKVMGGDLLISDRNSGDIGQETLFTENRPTLWSIIRANSNRVSESLRELEEFAKIYAPDIIVQLINNRYEIYRLELNLVKMTPHHYLNKYLFEGVVYPLSDSVDEIMFLICRGAKIVQLRDKTGDKNAIAKKVEFLCKKIGRLNQMTEDKILLILNDHVDIARAYPVAGVHIGQTDGGLKQARTAIGSNKIIGRSTHSIEQAAKAKNEGADYVGFGPIFETPTKNYEPVGYGHFRSLSKIGVPFVAIGGINKQNAPAVYQAGAKNIAVVRSAREFF